MFVHFVMLSTGTAVTVIALRYLSLEVRWSAVTPVSLSPRQHFWQTTSSGRYRHFNFRHQRKLINDGHCLSAKPACYSCSFKRTDPNIAKNEASAGQCVSGIIGLRIGARTVVCVHGKYRAPRLVPEAQSGNP